MAYDSALVTAAEASGAPIQTEKLICVEQADSNHNKFWSGFIYPNNTLVARYGRVGGHEAVDVRLFSSLSAAEHYLSKKVAEKQDPKKGYVHLRTLSAETSSSPHKVAPVNLAQIAIEQLGARDPETARIIDLFAKRNIHEIMQRTTMTYDESRGTFSTPLGIVTADAIVDARALLATMRQYVDAKDYESRPFKDAVNHYLAAVPQSFGMGRLDLRYWLPDMNAIASQNHILDSLQASLDLVMAGDDEKYADNNGDREPAKPHIFDVSLSLVEDGRVIDEIVRRYRSSMNNSHQSSSLDVVRVWEMNHKAMTAAFAADGVKVGNIRRLWHGSRAGNILSILSKGLIIPPSNSSFCAGRLYGDGIYASDQSTKALNYSFGFWDKNAKDNNCFMFQVDMAMGREYTPRGTYEFSGARKAKDGYDSTFAKGGLSGVANNELIVYRTSQVNLCHLVEFAPKSGAKYH